MNEELVYKNAKKDFLDSIKSHMSKQGFQEVDKDIFYERVRVVRQPGQTISINGQVMQQPGKEIEIKQTVGLLTFFVMIYSQISSSEL